MKYALDLNSNIQDAAGNRTASEPDNEVSGKGSQHMEVTDYDETAKQEFSEEQRQTLYRIYEFLFRLADEPKNDESTQEEKVNEPKSTERLSVNIS